MTLKLENVSSVYSGKLGSCCCGCSGKHSYASAHRLWATKNRGYKVLDAEVSDRSVKTIVGKINKALHEGKAGEITPEYYSAEVGQRLYIAYLRTASSVDLLPK